MDNDNYFDHDEEDSLHDAFLMIASDTTDYENLRDVIVGETVFEARSLDYWEENVDSFDE